MINDNSMAVIISVLISISIVFGFWILSIIIRKRQGHTFTLIKRNYKQLRPIKEQWKKN